MPLAKLTAAVATPEVLKMLEEAERLAAEHQNPQVNEAALTLALIHTATGILSLMLNSWATEEGLQRFAALLRGRIAGEAQEITRDTFFDSQGKLNLALFDANGRKFCQRLREDMASMGAKQVTTHHLLYTLLGLESGLLFRGLAIRGINVKRDLHTLLSRELARPGAKRNPDFALASSSLFGAVVEVFVEAGKVARERGANAIAEADVSRAFLQKQSRVLTQLFPKDAPLDAQSLRDYLDSTEMEEAEEEKPILRFTIGDIEKRINQRIRGQSQAVGRIMPWIKRLRFGLRRKGRPAAVFLFLGPTGTGKTQLAKELANYVFGDEDMLLFMEMGQFQTKESMSGFIGAPPGYVGYGEGKLTNGLRDKPECVVLFDEIEKADVQVFDTLLRFADEGLISDPAGPVRDGQKCIIVMTTNAGQTWLQNDYLKIQEALRHPAQLTDTLAQARANQDLPGRLLEAARGELQKKGFRPEFIGRVDELVTFLPFDQPTCREILDDILEQERLELLDLKGVELVVEERARDILTEKAMIRTLSEGARGIPRVVNEYSINKAIDELTDLEERQVPVHRLNVFEYDLGVAVEAA
jgi:ATP-dependent Clp protease ATP-binding subunit ClpC